MERRPAQVVNAFVAGGAIGAAGGAALGSSLAIGWAWGALIGAVVIGTGEAVTDVTRIRGTASNVVEHLDSDGEETPRNRRREVELKIFKDLAE